ncbi:MAG TPA: aminoglycoside 6'-N-acetyltransferase, partial [Clostridia bacterium]|nr:aminoglycoside 6'-N-acetyltransferase [Clostridia bacterium]
MIRQAGMDDKRAAAKLAMLLWPDNEIDDLKREMLDYIVSDSGAVFICFDEDTPIGFAQCSLRRDYVEGTDSSPVGYLEGVFVKENYRKRGIGGRLVAQCEEWAKRQGCTEFASDCELNNSRSLE